MLIFSSISFSQVVENEQVKRLQRSIFVYNFAQQVGGWPNFENLEVFKIGVLGFDRSVMDFQSLSQKRKIQNKAVEVVRFNSIKELNGIQLLYVNNKFNYDINYILDKISGKNILLITEDYNYNSSMINMINIGNSFEYEINSKRIEGEGFKIAPSLKNYAVSSSQKWKDLYKSAEKSLNTVKKIEARQEQLLKDKEEQILFQENIISKQKETIDTSLKSIFQKDEWILQLGTESEIQQRKYEDKLLIEKKLEESIQWQLAIVKAQEEQIFQSNKEIKKQIKYLTLKTNEIEEKDVILNEKNLEIDAQKTANYLLFILVILSVLGVLFIFRSYLVKKRLSAALDEKNNAIQQQAMLLVSKNKKLEQFNYIATHDLKVPITNLEGYYSFLKEDLKTDDKELLDTIYWIGNSIDQSKIMIDDLVQIIESGERQMNVELVHFEVLLEDTLESLRKEISRNSARVTYDFSQCSRINFGRVELRSILQNLISNAIKYRSLDRAPEIKINTSFEGDFILLSVSDNGLGINLESHSEDLFAAFKRIHTNGNGNGIGLYMIKDIVESSGGKIEVKSKPNLGTEFVVYLKRK